VTGPGALELAWADLDPICTEAVLQAVLELRPHAPLTRLHGLGRYPQLEDPDASIAVVERVASCASDRGMRASSDRTRSESNA
jgi:pimeloyl-ACP methyl ester carboxylesterase